MKSCKMITGILFSLVLSGCANNEIVIGYIIMRLQNQWLKMEVRLSKLLNQ